MAIRRAASEMGRKLGDESLTVADTAIGLASIATNTVAAMITNGAEPIRVR